jgi:hypothetical protein
VIVCPDAASTLPAASPAWTWLFNALRAAVPASTVVVVFGGLVVVVEGDFAGFDPKRKKIPTPNAASTAIAAKTAPFHLKGFSATAALLVASITFVSSPCRPAPTTPGIATVLSPCSATPSDLVISPSD